MNTDGSESSYDVGMSWGPTGTDTGLTNYTVIPTWDNTIGGSVGASTVGFISSDRLSGATNVIDTTSKYSTNTPYVPSPYYSDGTFYSDYARSISGNNALSDFNGESNTNTLISLGSSYVAATACHLYSTNGISAGNWYLPAMGEITYITPRYSIINTALNACSGVGLGDDYRYWSSTEYDSDNARRPRMDTGGIGTGLKSNTYYYARPFTALD